MSFSNYNNDLNILSRKLNSLINTNLGEKDVQSPFNNSHLLIQGQSDNNHIFYSQYHKSNVNLLDNQLNNSIKALKEKLMEKDQVIFEYIRKE